MSETNLVLTVTFLLSPKRRPDVLLVLKKSSGEIPSSVPKAKYIPLGFPVFLFHSSSRFFISVFLLEAKNKITPSMVKNDMGTMPIPKTMTPPGKELYIEELMIPTRIIMKKGMPIMGKTGAPVLWDILSNLSKRSFASISVMYGFALSGKNGGTTTLGCFPYIV